jgi:hypothetical protein
MAAKKRRRQRKKETGIDGLVRQMRESGLFKEGEIDFQPGEGPKLSAVFLDFIEPFREYASTDEAYQKLIAIAVIAWNATLLSKPERKELIDATIHSIVTTAGEEWRKDSETTLAMLIKHKERHFADDKRFIVDYRLTETENEYHLSMASFMKK